jgi:hypothetical protein
MEASRVHRLRPEAAAAKAPGAVKAAAPMKTAATAPCLNFLGDDRKGQQ